MRKPITLKTVSLILIAQRNNKEMRVGFIRIDTREMTSSEDVKNLNQLTEKYPIDQYTYTFHCIDDNCFYREDESKVMAKFSSSKKESIGLRDIKIIATNENQMFNVTVELHKVKQQ